MNRRQVLAALAGTGITAGSAWVLKNGVSAGDDPLPVRVDTLDAQGSTAGTQRVPVSDQPTLVDLFATWCAPCEKQMASLRAVESEFGDRIEFVSVTNERVGGTLSEDDLREWWRANDGDWTVGLDPDSNVMAALNADALPYLALADADGRVRWTHSDVATGDTLRRALADVLDGS